jgi:hypothetical protein
MEAWEDALMFPTIRRRRFGGERMHLDVAKETFTEYCFTGKDGRARGRDEGSKQNSATIGEALRRLFQVRLTLY